jgi:hypothetical protein
MERVLAVGGGVVATMHAAVARLPAHDLRTCYR